MTWKVKQSAVVTFTLSTRGLYAKIARCHPALIAGKLKCAKCGGERPLNQKQVAQAFRRGWPMCCGATMTLQGSEPGETV